MDLNQGHVDDAGDVDLSMTAVSREAGLCTDSMYNDMRSLEIKSRRVLVDWLCEVGADCRLDRSTAHVAVAYMDRVFATSEVSEDKYQLLAMTCLIMAAKFEEAEEVVPRISDLCSFAGIHGQLPQVEAAEVHKMEVLLLTKFDWCLSTVVPQHCLGYFFKRGLVFPDDTMTGKPPVPEVHAYVKKYLDFFAELVCQTVEFQAYLPSLQAAAIVVATRRAVNLQPNWAPGLEEVLQYTASDVQTPFLHLWLHYARAFPQQADVTDRQFGDELAALTRAVPCTGETAAAAATISSRFSLQPRPSPVTPGTVAAGDLSRRSDGSGASFLSESVAGSASASPALQGGRVATFHFAGASSTSSPALASTPGVNPYLSSARLGASASGVALQAPGTGGYALRSSSSAGLLQNTSQAAVLQAQPVNWAAAGGGKGGAGAGLLSRAAYVTNMR